MRKTSVYLDEDDAHRLTMLAQQEGESQSEVLRRAIRSYVPVQRTPGSFALDGVGEGPGGSVADLDNSALLEGFGS